MGSIARRLRREIFELYGYGSMCTCSARAVCARVRAMSYACRRRVSYSPGKPDCWTCEVARFGVCPGGRSGASCDAKPPGGGPSWPHGSLTEPGRSSSLEVSRPAPEAALALVGAPGARHHSKAREVRGIDRVVVRDGDAIGGAADPHGRARISAHLGGAPHAARGAGHRQPARQLRRRQPAPLRPRRGRRGRECETGVGDPQRGRGARPTWPRRAADEHRQASLEEFGSLADPPLTKDAVAAAASAGCCPWPTNVGSRTGRARYRRQSDGGDGDRLTRRLQTVPRTTAGVPNHARGSGRLRWSGAAQRRPDDVLPGLRDAASKGAFVPRPGHRSERRPGAESGRSPPGKPRRRCAPRDISAATTCEDLRMCCPTRARVGSYLELGTPGLTRRLGPRQNEERNRDCPGWCEWLRPNRAQLFPGRRGPEGARDDGHRNRRRERPHR